MPYGKLLQGHQIESLVDKDGLVMSIRCKGCNCQYV
jgi:hypothetical protein